MNLRLLVLSSVFVSVCVGVTAGFVGLGAIDSKEVAAESSQANETNVATKRREGFSPYVDQDGNIRLPKDYRQKWSHLGSWAVAKKPSETVHEMHHVYTQCETIIAFNQTGEFPDRAVLVKEVRTAKSDRLTSGHSAWSTDRKIWFVMVKDRKERFQDNDDWGDGWGWALFEAKEPSKNVSAGDDYVFTQYYPVLRAAKNSAKNK